MQRSEESAVADLPTCTCKGGHESGTSNGDKVCEWRGGNCSKYRSSCEGNSAATVCTMQRSESTLAMRASEDGIPLVVNLMAVLGFGATIYGALRHYTKF